MLSTERRTAPLTGLRVIEVGSFMAAPFAAMQLADLGADVIKVEAPQGDPVREIGPHVEGHSAPFARLNRGKRSIELNLKAADDRSVFEKLVIGADVLVENMRPGAMTRLGFGYEAVQAINPGLVYASVSGWGDSGPLAERPGLDIMAQAHGGIMSITGEEGGAPVKVGLPLCDLTAGLYTTMGILAALAARREDGCGEHVTVSLLEAGVSLAVWEAAGYFTDGRVGKPRGTAHQSAAPYQALRTDDALVTVGAISEPTWRAFCAAVDADELLEDPRFKAATDRYTNKAELIECIEKKTTQLSSDDLVSRLTRAGVPCARINNYAQVFNDEHLEERGFFWDSTHPVIGNVRQLGSAITLKNRSVVRGEAGPLLGADTAEIKAAFEGGGMPWRNAEWHDHEGGQVLSKCASTGTP